MNDHAAVPRDPDLHGVPTALFRAAEKARRLAEQTGTPFIVREPESPAKKALETGTSSV